MLVVSLSKVISMPLKMNGYLYARTEELMMQVSSRQDQQELVNKQININSISECLMN